MMITYQFAGLHSSIGFVEDLEFEFNLRKEKLEKLFEVWVDECNDVKSYVLEKCRVDIKEATHSFLVFANIMKRPPKKVFNS